ncbi:MAG: tRNA lysidine(34) synthetase TilS [Bacteroidota bacterium]
MNEQHHSKETKARDGNEKPASRLPFSTHKLLSSSQGTMLERRMETFLLRNHLITPRQSILLAVSAGIDSMVMLELFNLLRHRWHLNLGIVHINHQLRGAESEEDEEFVRSAAISHNFHFYSNRVDVKAFMHARRCSKQEAARILRYEAIENIRTAVQADAVATAHQANDNAETLLLNIIRGTGIHGLAGIPIHRPNGRIIRPLLFATRKEIAAYAERHRIAFREDSSNASLVYRRNELRHKILPALQKHHHTDIINILNRVSAHMRVIETKLSLLLKKKRKALTQLADGTWCLDLRQFSSLLPFMQEEFLAEMMRTLGMEVSEKHIGILKRLTTAQTGRRAVIGRRILVLRDRDSLFFVPDRKTEEHKTDIVLNHEYRFEDFSFSAFSTPQKPKRFGDGHSVEYIDASKLGSRLSLRTWKHGDRFIPIGMQRTKKVSDFFADLKIPLHQKLQIPIFESDGTIVWICGQRLDDRFKLTEETKKIIKLSYQPAGQTSS